MGQIFNNYNKPHHNKPFIEKPDPFIAMNTYDELGEIRSRTGIAIRDLDQRMDDFIGEINTTVDAGKIDITNHTNAEIVRITKHTDGKIVEITNHTDTKKNEITDLTAAKKTEIINLTNTSKNEISTLTTNSKKEISDLRDSSIADITNHTNTKKTEITNHTETKKTEITSHTNAKKVELDNYEKTKETQLNEYTNTKQTQLDQYEKAKEEELNTFTDTKKAEITSHTSSKITEITNHTDSKKTEITTHTNEKKVELDKYEKAKEEEIDVYVSGKKVEITNHTDAELERISATGIDTKLSVDVYNVDKTAMEAEINKKVDNTIYQSDKATIENNINTLGSKTITAGKGLTGGGSISSAPTINIVSADEGILVNDNDIKLNVVDNLIDGGVKKALSAEQGKVLKQLLDTIGAGGVTRLMRQAEMLSEYDYLGTLPSGGKSIATGKQLFDPSLYLNGVRIEPNKFSVELTTGLVTLNDVYSDTYDVIWLVEDKMPHHITFCFPTMNLLTANADMKNRIAIGDVIKILGESDADDGGHYLVKCEASAKLNAVDIGGGRFLNEIPNTKISDKLGKTEKAVDSDKLDGQDSTYFAKQTDMTNANTQINQNKSDILSKKYEYGEDLNGTGINLDNYKNTNEKTIVVHRVGSSNTAVNGINFPSDKGGELTVRKNYSTHIVQTYKDFNEDIFERVYGSSWSAWSKVFTTKNCPISKSGTGWCKLANGMILQWGSSVDSGDVALPFRKVTYPIAFSTAAKVCVTGLHSSATITTAIDFHRVVTVRNSRLTYFDYCISSLAGSQTSIVGSWIAVGY